MNYLLDTDTCVYYLKGVPPVVVRVVSTSPDQLRISTVTVAEFSFGACHSARVEHNTRKVDEFTAAVRVVDFDRDAAKLFGQIKARLRRAGRPIGDLDLMIGSVALAHGLTLVTNNEREFVRIPGLKIENWTA